MKFNEDVVPSNLNEAVTILRDSLTAEDVMEIQKENSDPSRLHFTLGMYLRNSWSLWEEDLPMKNWFTKEYGINHPDDISSIILDCLWRDVRNEPRQDKMMAEKYKKYWKKMESSKGSTTFKIDSSGDFIFDDGEVI